MAAAPAPLRLGLLGAARIGPEAVVRPCAAFPGAELCAVAARSLEKAEAFASEHGVPKAYGGYADLLADPDIDCVFNCLPNDAHHMWTMRAIAAGKHVLCEKPFTSNAAEAAEVAQAAADAGVVAMEAFHWRYHPFFHRVQDTLRRRSSIGTLQDVHIHFAANLDNYCKRDDNGAARSAGAVHSAEEDIRYSWDRAGGATMDLGAYCISFIRHVTGEEPRCVGAKASQWPKDPRIDEAMSASFELPSGARASFFTTFQQERDGDEPGVYAVLRGDRGTMLVRDFLFPWKSSTLQIERGGAVVEQEIDRFGSTGSPGASTYYHQLVSFCASVSTGGSLAVPTDADDAARNMRVVDAVYRSSGMHPRGVSVA